jgi:hypothetical protein
MSLGSISAHIPPAPLDPRLQARVAEESGWHTTGRVIVIAALFFTAIAVGIALGPIAALVVIVGYASLSCLAHCLAHCLTSCCFNPNAHHHGHGLTPSRVVPMNDGRHVHTGSGHGGRPLHEHRLDPSGRGHVHTGGGHPSHPTGRGHVHTGERHPPHGHPGRPGGDGLPPPSGPGGHVLSGERGERRRRG